MSLAHGRAVAWHKKVYTSEWERSKCKTVFKKLQLSSLISFSCSFEFECLFRARLVERLEIPIRKDWRLCDRLIEALRKFSNYKNAMRTDIGSTQSPINMFDWIHGYGKSSCNKHQAPYLLTFVIYAELSAKHK